MPGLGGEGHRKIYEPCLGVWLMVPVIQNTNASVLQDWDEYVAAVEMHSVTCRCYSGGHITGKSTCGKENAEEVKTVTGRSVTRS